MGERKKFTTTLDSELITGIKIRAIQENTDVSKLLEKLIEDYMSKDKLKNPIEFITKDTTDNK